MPVTYDNLFTYLEEKLAKETCDHSLRHTRAFARRHGLPFDELRDEVEHRGGYCDCEVFLNACILHAGDDEVIGELALRNVEMDLVPSVPRPHSEDCRAGQADVEEHLSRRT